MSTIKYTENHEWLKQQGSDITVGITGFAQQQLGDVVFVELPEVGVEHSGGDEAVVIESVKAAGGISLSLDYRVTEVNENLSTDPELINSSPMGEGWIFKAELNAGDALKGLMDETEYMASLEDS